MWDEPDPNPQQKPVFTPERPTGPLLPDFFEGTREVDFFKLFFTQELIAALVLFTNTYAHVHIPHAPYYGDRNGAWVDTTPEETYKFLGLVIMMGLIHLPKIRDYWSIRPLFHGNWARKFIPSRRRFQRLLTFFKVVDPFAEQQNDRLKKVRFLYEYMQERFKTHYSPGQCVSVDERIVRSKGRFIFRQYMPKKPVKWGTKIWALCDSITGYCFNFSKYTGQEMQGQTDVGLTTRVVTHLTEPLRKQGYVIYTDNYYTSPDLAHSLMDHGWNSQAKQDRCTSHLEGSPQLRQVRSARYYEERA